MKNIKTKTVKRHGFLVVFVAAILFGFTACEDDDFLFSFIAREDNDYTLPSPPSIVVDIRLNKSTLYMFEGKKETLTATFANTDIKVAVSWSSTDPTVASVDSNGKVTAKAYGAAVITAITKDGEKTAACDVTVINKEFEMVPIPAGTFMMGQRDLPRATPVHSVRLSGFYMGKYEVTQEQYRTVMGNNPSEFKSDPQAGETQGKRPVENVSWYDAVEFCNKLSALEKLQSVYKISDRQPPTGYPIILATVTADFTKNGYRLPTEAEWEYACRAGTTTLYNTGDTVSDDTGWYKDNSGGKTHEVGLKSPNAWGLYDMHGNVFEWCWDLYGDYTRNAQTNPLGAASSNNDPFTPRLLRGGSWYFPYGVMYSASRSYTFPIYFWDGIIGFRLVRRP